MTEHWSMRNLPSGEPVKGKTYRADGWAYFDAPWTSIDSWNSSLAKIGNENHVVLAMTMAPDMSRVRGQLLISPQGVAAMSHSDSPTEGERP